MRSKKLLSVFLVVVLCMSMLSGCSNVRKIEGASKDAQKMVAAIEKQYKMEGVKVAFETEYSGTYVSGSSIIDKKGNIQLDLSMNYYDADTKMEIDGKVLDLYVVDKVLYLDLTSGYDQIKKAVETAGTKMDELLSAAGMSENELKNMLVLSLELGDVDLSFLNGEDQQKMMMKLMDIFAVAVTEAECLDAYKGTYSIKLKGNAAAPTLFGLVKAFLNKAEDLYDASGDYARSIKVPELCATVVDKVYGDLVNAASDADVKKYLESSIKPILDLVKDMAVEYDAQLTNNRSQFVSAVNQLKSIINQLSAANMGGLPAGTEFSFSVTDEKEGCTAKGWLTTEGVTTNFKSVITEYKDEIKAPANATSLIDMAAKYVFPLLSGFISEE